MKRLIYLFIAVFLTSSLFAQSVPVPNGDFEAWDTGLTYDNATGWESPNTSLSQIPFNSSWVASQETTDAYAGTSSMKLECKDVSVITTTIQVPGFLTLGDLTVNTATQETTISGGVPFTDRPDKLTGWFKFMPAPGDMAMFEIVLLDYNATTQTVNDTIGSGYFLPTSSTTTWTNFEAIVNYTSTATPNYMNVNILSSTNTVVGSTLLVDNLELYTAPPTLPGLFFSEYIEGSSNNKAIEIFNGTGATVSLDEYIIRCNYNGNAFNGFHVFPVGATLADGDVWVIANSSADSAVLAVADETFAYNQSAYIVGYNGDDCRALCQISGTDTLIIDIIGEELVDPGAGWAMAGVTEATKDHTVVRKANITYGNTDWALSAGTDATNSEWTIYAEDEFMYLGTHNIPINSNENDIVEFILAEQNSPASINPNDHTVNIVVVPGTAFTALVPTITVSTDATVDPASGVAQDFTNPVTYTVTSQSGIAQAWTVTVSEYVVVEADLFFSEYIEGSSNNKALEIYNPTATTKNLDDYVIAQSSNGGGWAFYHSFPAGATLAAGEVWVIITDQVDTALFAAADADEVLSYPSVVHHNGDDARAIMKIAGTDSIIVDLIGDPNNDPGSGWDVAGTAVGTQNHTLLRKPEVLQGNTDWLMAAGTDAANSEWVVMLEDDFADLGMHTTGGNADPSLLFSEYIEGTGNNKALEIFNPTTATVNLNDYIIAQSSNGGGWAYYHNFPAGATLAAGEVWVIITDQTDVLLFDPANADEVLSYPSVVHHNGDDARAIMTATDSIIVDIIGVPDVDPGSGWDVAGTAVATQNHTLVRKPDVVQGNTDWMMAAGTDASNSEWIVMSEDDFSNLGLHSTGGNVAPVFSNVTILPEIVTEADDVTIGATVSDIDGTVTAVNFTWGLDGVTYPNTIVLTAIFDVYTTYPDVIPAQVAGTTVYFKFEATDNSGDMSEYLGNYTVTSPPQNATIYEIQGQVDVSPFDGDIVLTGGIVTGLMAGSGQGYFIQDGAGAWNGIFVYDNVNTPAIGDEITLSALCTEYYELTELKEVTDFVIVSSGNALPEPTLLSTLEANEEAYEGVFVKVTMAECLNDNYGFGMWEVNDGTGPTLVHNNLGIYEYAATIGEVYNIQGILNYNFSEWKIELRMDGDVTIYVGIDELNNESINLYPNPVSSNMNISSEKEISTVNILNVLGAEVYSLYEINNDMVSIDMSDFIPGIYIVKVLSANGNSSSYRVIKE